jgi:REP-associated tyrosine transposase
MVLYRRNRVPGGTYFFTVTLRNRKSALLVERIEDLRWALISVKREKRFRMEAWVVLPEHLHMIWTLPPSDADYSGRWRLIKARFSRRLANTEIGLSRNAKGEYDLWQRRFWEHTLRDEADFARHVNYVHFNPVKHGLVERVCDWPHSSFHRYVRRGIYGFEWGGVGDEEDGFGE